MNECVYLLDATVQLAPLVTHTIQDEYWQDFASNGLLIFRR